MAFVGSVGVRGARAGQGRRCVSMKVQTMPSAVRLQNLRSSVNSPIGKVRTRAPCNVNDAVDYLLSRGVRIDAVEVGRSVMDLLRELHVDESTVLAGLLRGMPLTEVEISNMFGEETLDVWRRDREFCGMMHANPLEAPRLSLVSMIGDFQCLVIELAHAVASLRHLPMKSLSRKTKEHLQQILKVHVPLADTLGLKAVHAELEELAFMHLYPEEYDRMCVLVGGRLEKYGSLLGDTIREMELALANLPQFQKVSSFRVYGRIKNCFSIYRKMLSKELKFEEVMDFVALRVILNPKTGVSEQEACERVMREVTKRWKTVEGATRDYISYPKDNGYQSLHTTILAEGLPMEVQVRTERMHECSEVGSAAHYNYKVEGLHELI
uniref:RelA/SpoT domain-containing protein n=1 Tax=Rhodosorus marinus TaxID=101924 RepID=A0A7S2ZT84_9RHOD|mmetsp:Transcript_31832/g.123583  ORF Transcript_31832/g.123583 Transcript_31832/m.123583 type:complete len:381 (+) Transcript_31832:356-1498(+)